MSIITRFRQFASRPLPQRMSAADTDEYIQPQPRLGANQYLTYWEGNQLPGLFIHTQNPHEVWISVKDKKLLYSGSPYGAQRTAGSFNVNLSQQGSAEVIAQWRATWQQARKAH